MILPKAIVVGGSGFIGSHIVRALFECGWQVLALDLLAPKTAPNHTYVFKQIRLPDPQLRDIFLSVKPKAVIFAAGTALVRESFEDPLKDYKAAVDVLIHLSDQLRLYAPESRLVLLSSAAVYGNPIRLPVREDDLLQPMSPYGFHKMMSEMVVREYSEIFGLSSMVFRLFSTFGPGLRRQVIWDIVQKAMDTHIVSVELRGTGKEARDFMAVEDIALTISKALEMDLPRHFVCNIASGEETSVAELADKVLRILGSRKPICFTGERDTGMPDRWCADITKLKSFGLLPPMDMEGRLISTVSWMRQAAQEEMA